MALALAMAASSSGASKTIFIASAILSISASVKPLDVTAGAPKRIPLALNGERVSPGTVFLFVVILARSSAFWASLPVSSGWLCANL